MAFQSLGKSTRKGTKLGSAGQHSVAAACRACEGEGHVRKQALGSWGLELSLSQEGGSDSAGMRGS